VELHIQGIWWLMLAGWLAGWPDHAQELIDVYCN
jgi:hypothetical protein